MCSTLPSRMILTLGMVVCFTVTLPSAQAANSNEEEALAYQARAVLHKHCLNCHGAEQPKAGLNILNYDLVVDGRGLVLPKAAPEFSELFQRVEEGSMPPGNQPKLSLDEQQVLRKWLAAQALTSPPNRATSSCCRPSLRTGKRSKRTEARSGTSV